MRSKTWIIYQLRVEGDEHPFYVGCTARDDYRRLIEHRSDTTKASGGQNAEKDATIRQASQEGRTVLNEVLEVLVNQDSAHEAEMRWITKYGRRQLGGLLVNLTDGGAGCKGLIHSSASRAKMAEAKKGNKINVGRIRPDMVERFSKTVTVFDQQGVRLSVYPSARKAAAALDVHFTTISDCLLGRCRSARSKVSGLVYQFRSGDVPEYVTPIIYKGR